MSVLDFARTAMGRTFFDHTARTIADGFVSAHLKPRNSGLAAA